MQNGWLFEENTLVCELYIKRVSTYCSAEAVLLLLPQNIFKDWAEKYESGGPLTSEQISLYGRKILKVMRARKKRGCYKCSCVITFRL